MSSRSSPPPPPDTSSSAPPAPSELDIFPVFVGHIPAEATPADLRGLFERAGHVLEVAIIAEHGFVNFSDPDAAREAIRRYNGRRLRGAVLHVDYSEELLRHLQDRGDRGVHFTEDPSRDAPVSGGEEGGSRFGRGAARSPQRGFPPLARGGDRSPPRRQGGGFGGGGFGGAGGGSGGNRFGGGGFGRRRRSRSPPRRNVKGGFGGFGSRTRSRSRSPPGERRRRRRRSPSPPPQRRSRSPPKRPRRSPSPSPPPRSGSREVHVARGSNNETASISPVESTSQSRQASPSEVEERANQKWIPVEKDLGPSPEAEAEEKRNSSTMVKEEEEDSKTDLRQLLLSRHKSSSGSNRASASSITSPASTKRNVSILGSPIAAIRIKVDPNSVLHDRKIELSSGGEEKKNEQEQSEQPVASVRTHQEIFVGNLLNDVESSDVERLLDSYGAVLKVEMSEAHAVVHLDCDKETSDKAIKALDKNLWMDNNISVSYHAPPVIREKMPEPAASISPKEETRGPKSKGAESESTSPESQNTKPAEARAGEEQQRLSPVVQEPKTKHDRKIKVRNVVVFLTQAAQPKAFLADITEIFSRFGTVESIIKQTGSPCSNAVSVGVRSSERQALTLISEVNGLRYKGGCLRARFEQGSEEDSREFREAHPVDFHNYPKEPLFSEAFLAAAPSSSSASSELPIGVLPPSSSLGAFGAVPSKSDMSSILRNVQAAMDSAEKAPQPKAAAPETEPLKEDPHYLSEVEGEIHAVHSKIVLVQFYTGFSFQLAKIVPGQMYADGKRSLGYAMRNSTYHGWPQAIKSFLRQGARVKMDVRRMSDQEISEAQELSSQYVMYVAPLAWRGAARPAEEELVLSSHTQRRRVLKGIVSRMYPKWGVLSHPEGEVFFKAGQYHDGRRLLQDGECDLLQHLAVGDLLAAQCERLEYLQMAEVARSAPGFDGAQRADSLRFMARLVWQIGSELDPHSFSGGGVQDADSVSFPPFDFLSTSSTLNRQLPAERDSTHRSWPATVESVHLPAGGTLLLDGSVLAGGGASGPGPRRVYFHRSRLFVNGVRLATQADLSSELVPGDPCSVDVVGNGGDAARGVPPFVYYHGSSSEVPWVATAVQVATRGRGAAIAKGLKDGGEASLSEDDPFDGRVVHFNPPSGGGGGVVRSGVAVLGTGPFAGQRVEFEGRQCFVYGHCLAKADLSQIFGFGERVKIRVKPYNSFCVETLHVGSASTPASRDEQFKLENYLHSHGLDMVAFQYLIKGTFPSRPFIPLPSQAFRGRVVQLRTSSSEREGEDNGGAADTVVLEADLGMGEDKALRVEAPREQVFVYGHWMGKADLRYVLQEGVDEVSFEYVPALEGEKAEEGILPRASLVWVGEAEDRPRYFGQDTGVQLTAKMDSALWAFVREKQMDEKMFRALVEGRLPPKAPASAPVKVTTSDGATIQLDQETLAQAALLQQMKSSFGSDACLKAMMMIMKEAGGSNKKDGDKSKENQDSSGAGPSSSSK